MILNVVVLIVSLVVLNKASDWTISNSMRVAEITGFGKTTVGFILVGFSTSLPELFVSVFAVLGGGSVGVAIGNVLGSNIVNICLILGLCFLLIALKSPNYTCMSPCVAKEEVGNLYFGLFIASMIPLALIYIGFASRFIGIVLLGIFIFNMYQLSKVKNVKEEGALGQEKEKLHWYTFLALLGAAGVVASSYFIVDSASYIALNLGVAPVIIGATVVALGTSLPELATSIGATRKGHLDLALGNIVGSCFINITLILAVALVASPLSIEINPFTNLALFSLITNLFLWYFLSSERISWRESAVLLFLYSLFLVITFGGFR
jgi:cation:H+ antiporter